MKKNAAIFKNNRLLRFQKGEKVLENNSVLFVDSGRECILPVFTALQPPVLLPADPDMKFRVRCSLCLSDV